MKENADKARGLDAGELAKQLREGPEQIFRLRFQLRMGQADGLKKLRLLRKERARMLTVVRERELGAAVAPQAAAPVEAAEDVEPFPVEKPRRAPPANVQEAIDQVSDIIEALRLSLDDMEEVLELLESLERQTGADERELEALRRQLRQLHRPQERPQSSHLRGRH